MAKQAKTEWRRGLPVTNKAFGPYAIALGQIALAWNEFHLAMSLLFCSIMGGGFVNQFLAIWHALKNDRAQREILKAAAMANLNSWMTPEKIEKLVAEIQWINAEANRIEDARDDALHSPLFASIRGPKSVLIIPAAGLGHKRAKKLLARKDLLAEFRWSRDSAMILTEYVFSLEAAASGAGRAWPDRPTMPNRGETNKRRRHHLIAQAKRPPPHRPLRA